MSGATMPMKTSLTEATFELIERKPDKVSPEPVMGQVKIPQRNET